MPWAIRPTRAAWDPNWAKDGWEQKTASAKGPDSVMEV
jgi:hypothetical protein